MSKFTRPRDSDPYTEEYEEARAWREMWKDLEREFGPFPEDGQYVRIWCKEQNRAFYGVVKHVTLAMDTPAICILDDEGVGHHAIPEFGDTWEERMPMT